MTKRKLIFSIFEAAFLGTSSSRVFAKILESTSPDLKGIFVAKIFRIPTDFFNFLEESPIQLTDKYFISRMLDLANIVDSETCLCIVNRIISVGATNILVDHIMH